MELAGLKVVMDADFSAVYAGFKQAEEAAKRFQQNTANIFKSVTINPDALAGAGKATEAVVKAQKEASAAIQEANVQWRNQAGTINNAISQNERYKAELAQVRTELKLTSAGQKDAAGNLRTVSSEVVNLRLREAQLKQAISENNISVRTQTKEMLAAHGSMVQLSQELGQMRTLYRQLSAEERNSPFGRQLVAQIKQADVEIKRLDASIGNHQRNVGNYASAFNPLNHNIAQITREFPAFANSMQTGFMAISNNIPLAVDSMRQFIAEQKNLQAQGKPSKTALQGLAGAVFSWNTALSAAITLSVVYGPKLVEMAKNGFRNADAIKKQKEYQEALNGAVKSSISDATSQIARIRVLNDTMTNANLTMAQRRAAYQEAIKQYPSYLSAISQDDALSGKLANTINNKLIPAILAAAQARAYERRIDLATNRRIELEEEQNKLLRGRQVAQQRVNAATQAYNKIVGEDAISPARTQQAIDRYNREANSLSNITRQINDNAKARIELNEEIEKYASRIQDAQKLTKGIGGEVDIKGIDDASTSVSGLKDEVKGLNEAAEDLVIKAMPSVKTFADAVDGILNPDKKFDLSGYEFVSQESADKAANSAKKAIYNLGRKIDIMLLDMGQKTAITLGESIGDAFSGAFEGIDFTSNLLNLIGTQIKALGEDMIKTAAAMVAVQEGIKLLISNPYVLAAAGVASIALGKYLQNQATKSVEKNMGRREFAAGGVVYGPTNALVGEYRGASSNPEVIAPLDKLTTILRNEGLGSGNMQPIVLTTRLDGQDLLLSQERAKKWRDR